MAPKIILFSSEEEYIRFFYKSFWNKFCKTGLHRCLQINFVRRYCFYLTTESLSFREKVNPVKGGFMKQQMNITKMNLIAVLTIKNSAAAVIHPRIIALKLDSMNVASSSCDLSSPGVF